MRLRVAGANEQCSLCNVRVGAGDNVFLLSYPFPAFFIRNCMSQASLAASFYLTLNACCVASSLRLPIGPPPYIISSVHTFNEAYFKSCMPERVKKSKDRDENLVII
jgi:hypothetical protein